MAEADKRHPRDREDVEAPDDLEVVTLGPRHPVLAGVEVDEVAAVRGDLFTDQESASSVSLASHGKATKSRGRQLVEHYVRPS